MGYKHNKKVKKRMWWTVTTLLVDHARYSLWMKMRKEKLLLKATTPGVTGQEQQLKPLSIGDLEEPYVALIDHGSEINLMSKSLYNHCKWPMDVDHRWMIRAANNSSGDLYAACPNVRVTIGDVRDD